MGLLAGVGIAYATKQKRQFGREIDRYVESLLSDAERSGDAVVTDADWEDVPAPVQRYFETVLDDGQSHVRSVRLRQHGEFRLGGPDASWRSLEATQHVTTAPPGFVWDATIDVLPMLPVRVIDRYSHGDGTLDARLRSAVSVADAGPSPDMNAGELVRYLAEAVWYPTALLPANGVEWNGIDERSAMATLEHEGASASVVFHFDENDEISSVTTERYRQEDDSYAPWTGYFRDYERRNGMRVPTAASVEWNLPDGDLQYWRANIDEIVVGPETAR
ncbi:DUF6920 family protein [Halorientalis brevis]|uniref:DUF6920 family protein n=1 Tax=Halorientalis brevis TaxID=1126241 RepID=A0ABD6CF78_9EURY